MSETIQQLKKPPYIMLAILFFGAFVSFLNNSLMNVALPTIMIDLGISDYSTVQWLSTGYMLVSGILIPVSAFLLTKFTNRALFITAMTLFTIGTGIAAIAPNFELLLTGRMIQAAGSSVMSPLLMNVMLISFPREKRGAAMGVFGLVIFVAPALGPTISGYIVEYYDWRLLFEMILPFSIISLVLAVFKLKNVMPTRQTSLDYMSVVLSTLGFGGLLYGCSSASSEGWSNPVVVISLIVGFISLVWFVLRQFKLDQPLLDLTVFKYPMYALGALITVVNSAAMFSGMILTPAYMQTVKGITPFDSGLMMLPGALLMGVMSPITGKLFDKFGPRVIGIIGLSITAATTYMMTTFGLDTPNVEIILIYSARMIGISLVMMPFMTNALNQLPTRLNPHGTAANNTLTQVAGAIGTAVFITIMNSHAKSSVAEQFINLGVDPATVPAEQMAEITRVGLLNGIQFAFLVATFTTIVALILAFFVKRVDVSKEALAKIEAEA